MACIQDSSYLVEIAVEWQWQAVVYLYSRVKPLLIETRIGSYIS